MPSFLNSLQEKAQAALNSSSLGSHIHRPEHDQPSANEAAATGGSKSRTIEQISHQFRSLQQQYTTSAPVQKLITAQKGVSLDFDGLSRDIKVQSKEFYTWGQSEDADLKDVTDRLAYINFVHGSLSSTLASSIDASRNSMKTLRNAESSLAPRRKHRDGLRTQIAALKQKNDTSKLSELESQLHTAETEDADLEKEIQLLKRQGVKESETAKWAAIREYAEKLLILSQATPALIEALPSVPPTTAHPYEGAKATASARASLQRALDNYKTGQFNLEAHTTHTDSNPFETRSFGETHAAELSSIPQTESPSTVLAHGALASVASHPPPTHTSSGASVPPVKPMPVNPDNLNHNPADIPPPSAVSGTGTAGSNTHLADPSASPTAHAVQSPTVAETGVPVLSTGPGPASGSLHNLRSAAPAHESAEDEKARLAREERERVLRGSDTSAIPPPAPASQGSFPSVASGVASGAQHESADDEKKRLEREERERVLQATSGNTELPPYKEF